MPRQRDLAELSVNALWELLRRRMLQAVLVAVGILVVCIIVAIVIA